jgi:hypothetical protein
MFLDVGDDWVREVDPGFEVSCWCGNTLCERHVLEDDLAIAGRKGFDVIV